MNFFLINLFILLTFGLGFYLGSPSLLEQKQSAHSEMNHSEMNHSEMNHSENQSKKAKVWTCSMHPSVQLFKFGKCPICFMDLIAVDNSDSVSDAQSPLLSLSPRALALADIRTALVEKKELELKIHLSGSVKEDPTRIHDISLLADAELKRLYVNYAGVFVKKGEHLGGFYSPEVYTAARDFVLALQKHNGSEDHLLSTAKTRLELLGMEEDYIASLSPSSPATPFFTLNSPYTGIVSDIQVNEGAWIKKGQLMFRIKDLSVLWVELDVYEHELGLVRYGQSVDLRFSALPAEVIKGRVSWIAPILENSTRTVRVRVNVPNPQGRLKPGFFAQAELVVKLNRDGSVWSPELEHKWICPMHPEITSKKASVCEVCEMDLVSAESLGFTTSTRETPLSVPSNAVLITGKRAVVYLEKEKGHFEGREVELGRRAGNFYLVKKGLKEGDRVVANGAFKLDSELQIQARPSMMDNKGGEVLNREEDSLATDSLATDKVSTVLAKPSSDSDKVSFSLLNEKAFVESLKFPLENLLEVHKVLAKDDFSTLAKLAKDLNQSWSFVDDSALPKPALESWNALVRVLKFQSLELEKNAQDPAKFRGTYRVISEKIRELLEVLDAVPLEDLELCHCPMAQGGYWLQKKGQLENPYYGSLMLHCGENKKSYTPSKTSLLGTKEE